MDRIIQTTLLEEDKGQEHGLRPQFFKDYVGQENAKKTLKVYYSIL